MSALPRPDLPPGPHRDLVDALHDLHHRAGWPSLRRLAAEAGCSHTTISKAFSSPALPSWGTLEVIAEAMGADTAGLHSLWLDATSPTSAQQPSAARIAGRRTEIADVRRHLESGSGLLLVSGEAGMGKSSVVFAAIAGIDTVVAVGHCLPLSTQVPLLPIADVLREVHSMDGGTWLEEALAGASPYVAESLGLLLPELERSGGSTWYGNDAWSRRRLFTAVDAALTGLSATRPLAILLEDLHWADDATLDLVEHLVTTGHGPAVTGTWRLDDPTTAPEKVEWEARVRRLAATTTLDLGPLSREGTGEQLALLALEPPSVELVDRIHRRTLGQPLFTEQLAAQIDDEQPFPRLLGDLLDQRLDGLQGNARSAAVALAVADRPLTDPQLREVTGLASGELAEGLRQLAERRLLAGSDRDVTLRHPLLAEAVRRSMVLAESVEAHRTIASAMAGWAEASAAEVAAHWQAADEHDRELEWRIMAARQAGARFASAQEADQWRRVIALWGDDAATPHHGTSLAQAYCRAADALDYAGRSDVAAAVLEEAAARLGDLEGPDKAQLLVLLGTMRGYTDPAAGLLVLDEAQKAYRDLPPSVGYVDLLISLAGNLHTQGRRSETAPRLALAAEVAARGGFVDRHRIALTWQAWDQVMYEGNPDGWHYIEEARRLVPAGPDPLGAIHCSMLLSDLLLKSSAPAHAVRDAAGPGLRAAQEWGIDSWSTDRLTYTVAMASLDEGHAPPPAEDIRLDPVHLDRDSHWLYLLRARLEILSGDLTSATAKFAELDGLTSWSLHRGEVLYHGSECLIWQGESERALVELTGLLQQILPTELSLFVGGLLSRAARAAADVGRASADRGRLVELRSSAHVDPFERERGPGDAYAHGLTWSAEMARLDEAQTVDHWLQAAAEWDRLTRPHDAAYCRWRGAEVASRTGHGTVAARLLRTAAADSREHVPLSRAIAATAAGSR